jgi:hypothetical protein
VREQPLLVVWEVVGNLELLLASGEVCERVGDGGSVFELTAQGRALPRRPAERQRARRPECG